MRSILRASLVAVAIASFMALRPAAQPRAQGPPAAAAAPCKYEQNCQCAVPGITVRWKAAYCMALNETDDLEQGGVQRCLQRPAPASLRSRTACEQNAYWKQMICRALHKSRKDIDECVRDTTMIPRFVEKGPGAGR